MSKLIEIRILPPIAIARMGNAEQPMENYDYSDEYSDNFIRKLKFKPNLVIENSVTTLSDEPLKTGFVKPSDFKKKVNVSNLIKPVSPFIELWGIFEGSEDKLVPLTSKKLKESGFELCDLVCELEAANKKIYRRTNEIRDIIEPKASTSDEGYNTAKLLKICGDDYKKYPINARADSFIDKKQTISFGSFQVCPPSSDDLIRLRFTPSKGKLYQNQPIETGTHAAVNRVQVKLDSSWTSLSEIKTDRHPMPQKTIDPGLFDDTCDCLLTIKIGNQLTANSRIFSGPPDFSPDTEFLRSGFDEFEQYLMGNEVSEREYPDSPEGNQILITEVINIMQRAVDTVSISKPFGMARRWYSEESIKNIGLSYFENQYVVDKHKQIFKQLLAVQKKPQTSNNKKLMAVWLNFLHDKLRTTSLAPEDKSDSVINTIQSYKMPLFMRGSDYGFLVLTERQRHKIKFAIERLNSNDSQTFDHHNFVLKKDIDSSSLDALDIMGLLSYRPLGNPPSTSIKSAVSNCMPGLEFDLRGIWQRFLRNNAPLESSDRLDWQLNDWIIHETDSTALFKPGEVYTDLEGNFNGAEKITLTNRGSLIELSRQDYTQKEDQTDRFNRLTRFIHNNKNNDLLDLKVGENDLNKVQLNELIDHKTGHIKRGNAGELTHGLCSPWQMDFRDCSCNYWSANRPDFINVTLETDDNTGKQIEKGKYWINKEDGSKATHDDLYNDWQGLLSFVIEGNSND